MGLAELERFRLESLAVVPESGGLVLRFDGIAGKVRSLDESYWTDHRLTLFERVRYSSRFNFLGVAVVWLLATSWGIFSVWRELRSLGKSSHASGDAPERHRRWNETRRRLGPWKGDSQQARLLREIANPVSRNTI